MLKNKYSVQSDRRKKTRGTTQPAGRVTRDGRERGFTSLIHSLIVQMSNVTVMQVQRVTYERVASCVGRRFSSVELHVSAPFVSGKLPSPPLNVRQFFAFLIGRPAADELRKTQRETDGSILPVEKTNGLVILSGRAEQPVLGRLELGRRDETSKKATDHPES